ncbi:MAG: dockerin type I repeat-containing protein [Ruminococcus sp.]|nr:dockerin type I repeat-containing protein [Ruminococcus sp.]
MKKLLSLLTCVALIMGILSICCVSSSAADVRPLFLEEEHDAQLKNTSDKLYFSFTAPESGTYEFYSVSDFDLYVKAVDEDGNTIIENDNGNGGGDFKATVYIISACTVTFEVGAYDIFHDGRFSVYIKESTNPVTKIEVTSLPDKLEYKYDDLFYDIDYSGLSLKATTQKGSTFNWTYNTANMYINGSRVYLELSFDNNDEPIILVTCGIAQTSYKLSIEPTNIESIEVLNPPEINLYENCDGFYDEDLGYFYYYYAYPYNMDVKITFKDKTTKIIDINEDYDGWTFTKYDDQHDKPFTLGKNPTYIEMDGIRDTIYVNVIETPVKNCVVTQAPTKVYTFGDDEFFSYNEYTDKYTLFPRDLTGLEFILEFKDGTKKTFTDKDIDYDMMTISKEPYWVNACDVTEGKVYPITLDFYGYHIKYNVTVLNKNGTLKGDVDGDCQLSILDATAIQMHCAGLSVLDDDKLSLGDVDCDSQVSVLDATQIQLILAGLTD